jgi:hypothetical protein
MIASFMANRFDASQRCGAQQSSGTQLFRRSDRCGTVKIAKRSGSRYKPIRETKRSRDNRISQDKFDRVTNGFQKQPGSRSSKLCPRVATNASRIFARNHAVRSP